MSGLIKREDIEELRARTDIKEVVEGYVSLRSGGLGSWKGLCPFHDERTPSFNVRPQVGQYHCFGCGEGGDVISFVQKLDHLSFTEAVEKLAARIGFELHYEQGSGPRREEVGRRQRLLDAHKIAAEYYAQQLLSPEAIIARKFLNGRGFDRDAAEHFGVGYAPQGWDHLLKHLRSRGFTEEELRLTGMFSTGSTGGRFFDRFRGRLIWPIRGVAGETVGFGARKLYDDDQGPKYLNTPETTLYKKSQVLYGIDLARKSIAQQQQLVVVEGYTDVMACHLSGIQTAVATCGTAFGMDHVKVARRLLGDDGQAQVIFTFDGDEAGQKAALKAFDLDQQFVSQTFVAVSPEGQDPCDLRISGGSEAVQELIASRKPLFEFAIRSSYDERALESSEGQAAALRYAAPIVARIKDPVLRQGYIRELAGWLGMRFVGEDQVLRAVNQAARYPNQGKSTQQQSTQYQASQEQTDQGTSAESGVAAASAAVYQRPDPGDREAQVERLAMEVVLQQPQLLSEEEWQQFAQVEFQVPAFRDLAQVVQELPRPVDGQTRIWLAQVYDHCSELLRPVFSELSVAQLPAQSQQRLSDYAHSVMRALIEQRYNQVIRQKTGMLQRMDPTDDGYQQLSRELMELQSQKRMLRGQ